MKRDYNHGHRKGSNRKPLSEEQMNDEKSSGSFLTTNKYEDRTMPTSSILDDIAKQVGQPKPSEHRAIVPFVRSAAKNAKAGQMAKMKPETINYVKTVIKAVKEKKAIPLPPDLTEETTTEPTPTSNYDPCCDGTHQVDEHDQNVPADIQQEMDAANPPISEEEPEVSEPPTTGKAKKQKEVKAKTPKESKEKTPKQARKATKKMLKKLEKKQLFDENGNPIEPTEKEILPDNIKVESEQYPVRISDLLEQFERGHLVLPTFQRKPVWKKDMREEFIEAIMIGIPVPMMFFAKDTNNPDAPTSLIDGCQRLTTLRLFKEGHVSLNGWTYDQLPESMKNHFLYNIKIPITEIKSERKFHPVVFRKLNRGGVPLNAIEIRRATYDDQPILSQINEMADQNQVWRELYGQNIRFKGLAILLGAKAMHVSFPEYKKPKDQFLDTFCENLPKFVEDGTVNIEEDLVAIDNILHACREVIGKSAFRIAEGNQPNAGLVECLIHAGFTVLSNKPQISIERLGHILKEVRSELLVKDQTYDALTKDTSGREKVQIRMTAAERLALERLG